MPIPVQFKDAGDFPPAEVVWLHGRWELYRQLYGTNPARIELLNEAAPTFLEMFQGIMLNHVQLTLSKLADPESIFKRPHLTLETLLLEIETRPEPDFAKQLAPLLADYRVACAKLKERRNKDITHFDFATQIVPTEKATTLPGPSRQEIDTALTALRDFIGCFSAASTTSTWPMISFRTMMVVINCYCCSNKGSAMTSWYRREPSSSWTSPEVPLGSNISFRRTRRRRRASEAGR